MDPRKKKKKQVLVTGNSTEIVAFWSSINDSRLSSKEGSYNWAQRVSFPSRDIKTTDTLDQLPNLKQC